MSSRIPIIDCHVHLRYLDSIPNLLAIYEDTDFIKINILSLIGSQNIGLDNYVNDDPVACVIKAENPGRFYTFSALDHAAYLARGEASPSELVDQLESLLAIGADGIKMLRG